MISFADMRAKVLDGLVPLAGHPVRLGEADGLVLTEDVIAHYDLPLFDNSAMDGYALRWSDIGDLPSRLRVVGVSSAGHPMVESVSAGEAARILTGAQMVPGTDTIVPVEATSGPDSEGYVDILEAPSSGRGSHLRRAGAIVARGDTVAERGLRLNIGHLGHLAALGIAELNVHRLPSVAILSTGDELVRPGTTPAAGQIFESNTVVLEALLERMGCEIRVARADDDIEELVRVLDELSGSVDVIISTGGVSMGGEYDALRNATDRYRVDVFQVAMKPAKPFAFGNVNGALMFGLPGNPASALVSFESFVRPALRKLSGVSPVIPAPLTGRIGEPLDRNDDGKVHFVPVRMGADRRWYRTAQLVSHSIASLAESEAMLMMEGAHLDADSEIELIRLWNGERR